MKNFVSIFSIFAGIFSIFLCACSSSSNESFEPIEQEAHDFRQDLADTVWIPYYILGQENCEIPKNAKTEFGIVSIAFSNSQNGSFKVSGMSGANLFSGTAEISDSYKIQFKNLVSTMRLGTYSDYESLFLKALARAKFIEIEPNFLSLFDEVDGLKVQIMSLRKAQ